MINVTAAIIKRDGRILIAKRSSTSSLPNKWEFPGGKVESGETPEECLQRELLVPNRDSSHLDDNDRNMSKDQIKL